MKREMAKTYEPAGTEDRLYAKWLEMGYFHPEPNPAKEPYTIVIPPPNITSQLHMGHAYEQTLLDILTRFKRMQGHNALWLPGTDHASIATEVKIVERLAAEGVDKEALGRDGFLKRAWQWYDEYGSRIVEQMKKLGSSCDWERIRFTMDDGLSAAVTEFFVRLYEKGLIYRGEKLVNWCPECQTTISDAEVEHVDTEAALYHIKYPVKGTELFIQFATTRPETILADTAVAVNPDDERFKELVGKTVTVPFVNREIPIIADSYVDMAFGTGALKITPGHDPNDFLVGERHNLQRINILNDDGTLNELAGVYTGMDCKTAREAVLKDLTGLGLYVKSDKLTHAVGTHDRCHKVIEPMLKVQWFVKMDGLAKPAIEAYKSGDLRIFPDRFGKVYLHWLENIRDWCVSRQLWWGHRIPAYYCSCGEITVAREEPGACPKCGGTLTQDPDVLDTWFSSALWPFSTLGWPEETEDYKYFYPTNTMVMGWEILFFWGVRMIFSGLELTGKLPFRDMIFHGMVRDEQGRKMSKSLGNGVDPLIMIDKYGTDALRFSLITGNTPGEDFRFREEKINSCRNFCNKIWNAARFIMMNMDDEDFNGAVDINPDGLADADRWLLSSFNRLAGEVTALLEVYDLGLAASKIYEFVWDVFCDWAIEMYKPRLYNKDKTALAVLRNVFLSSLKLLHPFMPFITEEVFTSLQAAEATITLSAWPAVRPELDFPESEGAVDSVRDTIKAVRVMRADKNVPLGKKADVIITVTEPELLAAFRRNSEWVKTLATAESVVIGDSVKTPDNAVSAVIPGVTVTLSLEDIVDKAAETARLVKERERLLAEVARVDGKLANKGFTDKAPASVVEEERKKGAEYREMLAKVEGQIEELR